MKVFTWLFSLLAILFVMDSSALANPLTLPEPKGVYGIAMLNVELSDPTRTQLRSGDKRRWMATVFYPTLKAKATAPYMTGTIDDGNVCGTKILGHAIPGALMIQDRKFPIIISLPGRGGERQKETILYEALASHGYIVITIDQPYVANFVKFSDGTKINLTFKDMWNLPRDRDYRYAYDDEIIAHAIKDIDFVLENFQDFVNISSAFDTKNIILMGHSIGANIAQISRYGLNNILNIL